MVDKSGTGIDDVCIPKWVHFERLRFLNDFVASKQSISNVQKVFHITNLHEISIKFCT